MLEGVDRVLMRVDALEAAIAYYRDVLGMTLLRVDRPSARGPGEPTGGPGSGATGLAAFELSGGAELILHNSPDLPASAVYFRVSDVAALHARREELRLHFVKPPGRTSRGRSGTVRDPFGNVLLLLDRSGGAGASQPLLDAATTVSTTNQNAPEGGLQAQRKSRLRPPVKATAASPAAAPPKAPPTASAPPVPEGALFAGVEERFAVKKPRLVTAYTKVGRTADDLPYTHHFESLFAEYAAAFPSPGPSRREVWRHLLTVRKGGDLPRLGEARSTPPAASEEERALLRQLLGKSIGRRDRLPYAPDFDRVVETFARSIKRPITPHQVWRLVATLAK